MNIREKRLDVIKGIAIILVVIGHNIQLLKGTEYAQGLFNENAIFSLIYSFHMPVFMLISGYLFYGSINKYSSKTIIIKRVKSLIVPVLFWTLLVTILLIIFNGATFNPLGFVYNTLISLWFLWAVFYCSIGLIIGNKFFNDNILFHLIVLVVLLFIPDVFNKELYAFMYPYFIIGYYTKKYEFNVKKVNFWGVLIAYLALLYFWDTDKYIHSTGIKLIGETEPISAFLIDIYRWVIGILGSLVLIKLVDVVCEKYKSKFSLLTYLGKNSLGLYILDVYISIYVLSRVTIFKLWNELEYTLICIVFSIVVIGVSILIINLIKKSRVLNTLFLGSNFKS